MQKQIKQANTYFGGPTTMFSAVLLAAVSVYIMNCWGHTLEVIS